MLGFNLKGKKNAPITVEGDIHDHIGHRTGQPPEKRRQHAQHNEDRQDNRTDGSGVLHCPSLVSVFVLDPPQKPLALRRLIAHGQPVLIARHSFQISLFRTP